MIGSRPGLAPHRAFALMATALALGACATALPLAPAPFGAARYGPPGRAADLDGLNVVYTVEGPAGAPAVVLIHPWAGSLRVWDALAPALARTHRVVRLDLPGHGASDKPDIAYDVPLGARAVTRVMDDLGLARAALVGNSLGGGVALAVTREHPERVSRLVLIDALGAGPVPDFFAFFIRDYFTAALFHSVDDGLITLFADLFVFDTTGPATDAFLSQLLSERAHANGWWFSRAITRYLRSATRYDATPGLAAITAPTLVVWGDGDLVIAESAGERLARAIPGARWVVLDDCGHMPELDCPAALAPLLAAFLDDGDAPAPTPAP